MVTTNKYISKKIINLNGNYKIYMNHNGIMKECNPFIIFRKKISDENLYYKLDELPEEIQIKYISESIDETKLAIIKEVGDKQFFIDSNNNKIEINEDTLLLPIVGNFLPDDEINAYRVIIRDNKLFLSPILVCINCHWADLFSGNTRYGNNVFCLASDIPKDKIDDYLEDMITLKEAYEYLYKDITLINKSR